ncbi:MAG: hypothetical protein AAFP67_12585 [Pseudomonadota bacterium]
MTIDFVFLLMLITLGGGLAHAIYNLEQTRRLRGKPDDAPLPRVYREPGIARSRRGAA